LVLAVIAAVSGWSGYRSGIALRTSAQSTQVASGLNAQLQRAQQDMNEKQYDQARQRLEYIISIDPAYPGAADMLSEVLLHRNSTATPTVAPTPTLTPTPDTRTRDQLYDEAKQYLADSNWTAAIDTLLRLRKEQPDFNMVEVDGMLFLALRNRGRDKIVKEGDLEGGIYDLSLAERFGPLDSEAQGFANWASIYITGASFWGINWEQAVNYFSQVAPQLPNLRDGSGMTAAERYRVALKRYGDSLLEKGDCEGAAAQYEAALNMGSDPEVEQALEDARKNCSPVEEEAPAEEPAPEQAPVETTAPENTAEPPQATAYPPPGQ
jgi:tetratricopeptide (TPR) repeat protein